MDNQYKNNNKLPAGSTAKIRGYKGFRLKTADYDAQENSLIHDGMLEELEEVNEEDSLN